MYVSQSKICDLLENISNVAVLLRYVSTYTFVISEII